jgi:hypothetical protein
LGSHTFRRLLATPIHSTPNEAGSFLLPQAAVNS